MSGSGPYFEPEPEPVGLTSSLRPQLRPASFAPESVEPVDPVAPQVLPIQFASMQPQTLTTSAATDNFSSPKTVNPYIDAISSRSEVSKDFSEDDIQNILNIGEGSPLAGLGILSNPRKTSFYNVNIMPKSSLNDPNQVMFSEEFLDFVRANPKVNKGDFMSGYSSPTGRSNPGAVAAYEYDQTLKDYVANSPKRKETTLEDQEELARNNQGFLRFKDGRPTGVGQALAISSMEDMLTGAGGFSKGISASNPSEIAALEKELNSRLKTEQAVYSGFPQASEIRDELHNKRPMITFSNDMDKAGIVSHELGHLGFTEVEKFRQKMLNDDREKVDDSGNQINSFAYEYGNPLMRQMNKYPANQEQMTQLFDAAAPPYMGATWDDKSNNIFLGYGAGNLQGAEGYKQLKRDFDAYRRGDPVDEFPTVDLSNYYGQTPVSGKFKDKILGPDNIKDYLKSEGITPRSVIRRRQGLDGLLLATSDATADKLGIDRMEFRMSQGLKINPVGADGVVRSVRPRLRPQGLPPRIRPRLRPQGLGSLP